MHKYYTELKEKNSYKKLLHHNRIAGIAINGFSEENMHAI